jgi:hypothetical protein
MVAGAPNQGKAQAGAPKNAASECGNGQAQSCVRYEASTGAAVHRRSVPHAKPMVAGAPNQGKAQAGAPKNAASECGDGQAQSCVSYEASTGTAVHRCSVPHAGVVSAMWLGLCGHCSVQLSVTGKLGCSSR